MTPYPHRIAALLLPFAPCAHALQPLITDDTGTQGRGGHQLEAAWNVDRSKNGTDSDRQQSLPLTFTVGATDALDLFFAVTPTRLRSGATDSDSRGLANTAIGAKWRFHEITDSKTTFAVKPQLLLPVSGSREAAGLGAGKAAFDLTLIASRETSFGALHLNVGAWDSRHKHPTNNPNTRHTRVSLAPVWDFTEHFKLVADAGLAWHAESGTGIHAREHFLELGDICSPSKNLDFSFGLIHCRASQTPQSTTHSATLGATLGATWRY